MNPVTTFPPGFNGWHFISHVSQLAFMYTIGITLGFLGGLIFAGFTIAFPFSIAFASLKETGIKRCALLVIFFIIAALYYWASTQWWREMGM